MAKKKAAKKKTAKKAKKTKKKAPMRSMVTSETTPFGDPSSFGSNPDRRKTRKKKARVKREAAQKKKKREPKLYCHLCDTEKPESQFHRVKRCDQRQVCLECAVPFVDFLFSFIKEGAEPGDHLKEPTISWKEPIDVEKLEQFQYFVTTLSRFFFGTDDEGDTTVSIHLEDRTRGRLGPYRMIPKDDETIPEALHAMSVAEVNLSIAQREFEQQWKIFSRFAARHLTSGQIKYDTASAARVMCLSCCHGSKLNRRDDGTWWHYDDADAAELNIKPSKCLATNFHEAEHQNKKSKEKSDD